MLIHNLSFVSVPNTWGSDCQVFWWLCFSWTNYSLRWTKSQPLVLSPLLSRFLLWKLFSAWPANKENRYNSYIDRLDVSLPFCRAVVSWVPSLHVPSGRWMWARVLGSFCWMLFLSYEHEYISTVYSSSFLSFMTDYMCTSFFVRYFYKVYRCRVLLWPVLCHCPCASQREGALRWLRCSPGWGSVSKGKITGLRGMQQLSLLKIVPDRSWRWSHPLAYGSETELRREWVPRKPYIWRREPNSHRLISNNRGTLTEVTVDFIHGVFIVTKSLELTWPVRWNSWWTEYPMRMCVAESCGLRGLPLRFHPPLSGFMPLGVGRSHWCTSCIDEHLVLSDFLIFADLSGIRWCLGVVLLCVPAIMNEAELPVEPPTEHLEIGEHLFSSRLGSVNKHVWAYGLPVYEIVIKVWFSLKELIIHSVFPF